MELGKQIKRYRMEREISQEDLAAKLYISRQTVSNWETDKTYPDVENLLLLSVFFDVTIDELIKGDVEAMKETVSNDYKKMSLLSWGGLVIALVGGALTMAGISFWDWGIVPSAIIGLLVWGGGMAMIIVSERIMKKHDLITYREVLAYAKGEPVDRSNPRSQRARQHRAIKTTAILLCGALAGAFIGYFGYLFFG